MFQDRLIIKGWVAVFVLFCSVQFHQVIGQNNQDNKIFVTTTFPDTSDKYPGCKFKGNYVYAGAINLVWNEVNENILREKIILKTKNTKILKFEDLMNNFQFGKKDLDLESYYLKSGFGQKTVDIINSEVSKKFPESTIAKINVNLLPSEMVAYAYIFKNVQYENKFDPEENFKFVNEKVKGFFARSELQKRNIFILNYWTDDKFIVRIKLKNPKDELILAKGFNLANPIEVMAALLNKTDRVFSFKDNDVFGMPEVHFLYDHAFVELDTTLIENQKFRDKKIKFLEKVKFDLDFNGVRLENTATMFMGGGAATKPNKILILDKPFWIIMKRKESSNPYFILGVNNTEIMTKSH